MFTLFCSKRDNVPQKNTCSDCDNLTSTNTKPDTIIVHKLDSNYAIDPNELTFTYYSDGNMFSFTDSMSITKNAFIYRNESSISKKFVSLRIPAEKEDWNSLVYLLDLDKFKAVDLNSCFACVDGIDYIVTIKKGKYFHEIRYAYYDLAALRPIQPFLNKLEEIKLKYLNKYR